MKNLYCLLTVVAVMGLTACSTEEYTANCPKGKTAIVYLSHRTEDSAGIIAGIASGVHIGEHDAVIIIADNGTSADITMIEHAGNKSLGRVEPSFGAKESSVFDPAISRALSLREGTPHSLIYLGNNTGWLPDASGRMPLREMAVATPDGAFENVILSTSYCSAIEVAYELRTKSRYVIASVGECPASDNIEAIVSASLFSDGSGAKSLSLPPWTGEFTTISTADLADLSHFVLANCDLSTKTDLTQIPSIDNGERRLFFDFRAYYSSMLKNDSKRVELSALLDKCVTVSSGVRSGGCPGGLCGLTTYIPQKDLPDLTAKHRKTAWVQSITFGITVNPWTEREIEVEL